MYYPQQKAKEIYRSERFFRDLPPLPGACDAVLEMDKMDKYDFCTLIIKMTPCNLPLWQLGTTLYGIQLSVFGNQRYHKWHMLHVYLE